VNQLCDVFAYLYAVDLDALDRIVEELNRIRAERRLRSALELTTIEAEISPLVARSLSVMIRFRLRWLRVVAFRETNAG